MGERCCFFRWGENGVTLVLVQILLAHRELFRHYCPPALLTKTIFVLVRSVGMRTRRVFEFHGFVGAWSPGGMMIAETRGASAKCRQRFIAVGRNLSGVDCVHGCLLTFRSRRKLSRKPPPWQRIAGMECDRHSALRSSIFGTTS